MKTFLLTFLIAGGALFLTADSAEAGHWRRGYRHHHHHHHHGGVYGGYYGPGYGYARPGVSISFNRGYYGYPRSGFSFSYSRPRGYRDYYRGRGYGGGICY